eukprot:6123207-Amphidinium_carterae.1
MSSGARVDPFTGRPTLQGNYGAEIAWKIVGLICLAGRAQSVIVTLPGSGRLQCCQSSCVRRQCHRMWLIVAGTSHVLHKFV